MIKFIEKGDFKNLEKFLKKSVGVNGNIRSILDRYGAEGVQLLAAATPVDSGNTKGSWYYTTYVGDKKSKIVWSNSNIAGSTPVAILLQYGHMTGNGGYVQGLDFINPALRSMFERLSDDIWKEVCS